MGWRAVRWGGRLSGGCRGRRSGAVGGSLHCRKRAAWLGGRRGAPLTCPPSAVVPVRCCRAGALWKPARTSPLVLALQVASLVGERPIRTREWRRSVAPSRRRAWSRQPGGAVEANQVFVQAGAGNAAQRGAGGEAAPANFIELAQERHRGIHEVAARGEGGVEGELGAPGKRAGSDAKIATEHVTGGLPASVGRHPGAGFDGPAGDAAPGVEYERVPERAGGAGVQAAAAGAASQLERGCRRQLGCGHELAEQDFWAKARMDEHRRLAHEAEPCPGGERPLQQRRGVNRRAPTSTWQETGQQPAEAHETGSDRVVVVASARVAGKPSAIRGKRRVGRSAVGHGDADDASGAGKKRGRVGTHRLGVGEVGELGRTAGGAPARQRLCLCERLRRRHAIGVEAEFAESK